MVESFLPAEAYINDVFFLGGVNSLISLYWGSLSNKLLTAFSLFILCKLSARFRKIALTAELYSGKDFRLVADRAWTARAL